MDKNKLFKIGKILGMLGAVGYVVYENVKRREAQEIIDISVDKDETPVLKQ